MSTLFRKPNLSKGFTLVELLVVVAVIGVLATLILLQLGAARARARDAKRIADVSQIRTAIELYYDDQGSYPAAMTSATLGTYFGTGVIPTDPNTGWDYDYAADPAANPDSYHVYAELERRNVSALAADASIDSSAWGTVGYDARSSADATREVCSDTTDNDNCVYDLGVSQ